LPLAALLAVFFWWRGHHQPGGGFVAGLCLGAAVVLVAAARGGMAARTVLRASPLAWAGSGLAIAWLAGMVGVVAGGGFLFPHWLGPLGTPMLFDLGVMILVVGIVVMAVERLLEAEEGPT
jgi:multisubunit Na+/H+ antiporter MnhB subunit